MKIDVMPRKHISVPSSFLFSCLKHDAFGAPSAEDVRFGMYEFLGTTLFLFFGLLGCQSGASVAVTENGVVNTLGALDYCASSMSVTLFVLISIFFRSVLVCKVGPLCSFLHSFVLQRHWRYF
jgi:hypothetical protein